MLRRQVMPCRATEGSASVSRSQAEGVRRRGQGKQTAQAQVCPLWMTPRGSGPHWLSARVWYPVPGWLGWVDGGLRGAWEPDKGEGWGAWLSIAWLAYESRIGYAWERQSLQIPEAPGGNTCVLSRVWLFATSWTIGHQDPLSMGFSRQEYWSGLPLPRFLQKRNFRKTEVLYYSHFGHAKGFSNWLNLETLYFRSRIRNCSEKKTLLVVLLTIKLASWCYRKIRLRKIQGLSPKILQVLKFNPANIYWTPRVVT